MTPPVPPGVYVTEKSSGVRSITGASTSIPAFLGYTRESSEKDPNPPTPPYTNAERATPRLVRGWPEFVDRYSMDGLAKEREKADTDAKINELERCFALAEAVYGFFANGGRSCYVVGFTDPTKKVTDSTLKGAVESRTGLGGLETEPRVSMVAVPNLWEMTRDVPTTDPPPVTQTDGKPLIDAVLAHCTGMHNRLALIDPPADLLPDAVKDFAGAQLASPDAPEAAFTTLYYPWVKVPGVEGRPRTVPPCGHLAGVWARTDAERGVFKAPANAAPRGVLDLPVLLTDGEQGELNAAGVNCLRSFPDRGLLVWGARTRSTSRDWKYLNVRRLICFLRDSIQQSSTWAVFEPNDQRLWGTLRQTVATFLLDQWREGALVGRTPEEAFYVICDETNNPREKQDLGEVHCDIGVAPVRPAEFVHFTITQIAGPAGT
ncbi:phage tail sheath C-terminal domain-containing protein [Streptomyces sp. NPDC047049]|uniref:phage tail sheath family protein n=1 Tax=Streptomyces sp. NPDC047049 TaxID=3156688 RepID=UPI00340C5924